MKHYKFIINGNQYEVEVKDFSNNIAELEVNGTPYSVEVDQKFTKTKTPRMVRPAVKAPVAATSLPEPSHGAATPVLSPLPGTILQISVKAGDQVVKGDKLLVMEAMKMENNIQAERDGVVKSLKVSVGDNVLQGSVLLEIE